MAHAADLTLGLSGSKGESARVGDLAFANFFFPELLEWEPVLDRLGVSVKDAISVMWRGGAGRRPFQAAFLASGRVEEAAFFRALAAHLGLSFLDNVDPESVIFTETEGLMMLREPGGLRLLRLEGRLGLSLYAAAPDTLAGLQSLLARHPAARARLAITTPTAIRQVVVARMSPVLLQNAVGALFGRWPEHSARIVATAWQGSVSGALLTATPVCIALDPMAALIAVHVLSSVFFVGCIGLRFAALASPRASRDEVHRPVFSRDLPVYSVLVALYKEAEVVPELLVGLSKLVWPRDRLEIKLVCEAGDKETIDAIRAHQLRDFVEVVEVPSGGPRTKPKALSYALPLVSGEFVVLFDAEDRPHPLQLFEAFQRFSTGDPSLACLQAPLEIGNRERGSIARLFAFEYVALFRGLLPFLSRHGLMFPLGGTSNHFRRPILDSIGGWDPYNVTEDADLGLRLARFGYRAETLRFATIEDAPEDFKIWLPQRTRWFKGWVQTWLVHMRSPKALKREIGGRSFLVVQVLLAGMVVSSLVHPLLFLTAAFLVYTLVADQALQTWQWALLCVDAFGIVGGYLSFLLLGWRSLQPSERRGYWRVVLFTPVYWMMLSAAAWRAVWQIWRNPHLWEKTPHRKARSDAEIAGSPAFSLRARV